MTGFWRPARDGVSVAVRVQPKARRTGLLGRAPDRDGERLRIGVSEPAEAGRANDAVRAVLADLLDVPAGAVSILQGASSRQKTLRVQGAPEALAARLATLA